MELVLRDSRDYPIFVAEITELDWYCVTFKVFSVSAWFPDENGKYTYDKLEEEYYRPYLSAYIKWDGCSHVDFGEPENKGRDGYLHLCGVDAWKEHVGLMEWLYKEASRLIENFDRSEFWE